MKILTLQMCTCIHIWGTCVYVYNMLCVLYIMLLGYVKSQLKMVTLACICSSITLGPAWVESHFLCLSMA